MRPIVRISFVLWLVQMLLWFGVGYKESYTTGEMMNGLLLMCGMSVIIVIVLEILEVITEEN